MSEEFSKGWPHGHIRRGDNAKARLLGEYNGRSCSLAFAVKSEDYDYELISTRRRDGRIHEDRCSYEDIINAPAPAPDWEKIARELWAEIHAVRAYLEGGAAEDASAYDIRIAAMNAMDCITRANLSQHADAFKCR